MPKNAGGNSKCKCAFSVDVDAMTVLRSVRHGHKNLEDTNVVMNKMRKSKSKGYLEKQN